MHVMRYVGDMYADLVVPVFQPADRERVVEILRIGRIDRECRHAAHVASRGDLLVGDRFGNFLSFFLDLLGIAVRQIEFGENRMHLGIVVARLAEHVDDLSFGAAHRIGPTRDLYEHLFAAFRAMQGARRHENIRRHLTAVDANEREGVALGHLDDADVVLLRPLDDFDDLAFGIAGTALAGDGHAHPVAVQRMVRPRGIHVNILVHTLHDHVQRARGSHVDRSLDRLPLGVTQSVFSFRNLLDHALRRQIANDSAHPFLLVPGRRADRRHQALYRITLIRQRAEQLRNQSRGVFPPLVPPRGLFFFLNHKSLS